MTQYRAPLRDIQFLLHDVFAASKTWSELPFFADTVDADIASAVLEEAARLSSRSIRST